MDSGIAPLPPGDACVACYGQARAYPAGELSGSTFSDVHFARLAYIKRAAGNASGAITGYLSFETDRSSPADSVSELVLRDLDFNRVACLKTLAPLNITAASQIEQIGQSGLFISMTPAGGSLQLFRLNANDTSSPSLHTFQGFNSDTSLRKHLSDGAHLYFADANRLVRLPLDADGTSDARVLTTLDSALKTEGQRQLDLDSSPARIVFEAVDEDFTVESGVFSVATDADNAQATILTNYPDSDGGEAKLQAVAPNALSSICAAAEHVRAKALAAVAAREATRRLKVVAQPVPEARIVE